MIPFAAWMVLPRRCIVKFISIRLFVPRSLDWIIPPIHVNRTILLVIPIVVISIAVLERFDRDSTFPAIVSIVPIRLMPPVVVYIVDIVPVVVMIRVPTRVLIAVVRWVTLIPFEIVAHTNDFLVIRICFGAHRNIRTIDTVPHISPTFTVIVDEILHLAGRPVRLYVPKKKHSDTLRQKI